MWVGTSRLTKVCGREIQSPLLYNPVADVLAVLRDQKKMGR